VTPNNTHYEVAKSFLEKGIHVVCEKPLCFTTEQAEDLKRICKEKNLLFCVTYTYTGYNMIKLAKELVEQGALGEIININAEYLQEWLIDDIGSQESATSKLSVWRKNPEVAGASNCVGDIGSHIEALVHYVTGLEVKKVAAVLDYYGQPLDLNANMLVEMSNGAHGVFCSSQVCAGHTNGLVIRIYGTDGAIKWVQEDANYLYYTKKGCPIQRYEHGTGYVTGTAAELNRVPSGHPEGIMIAFANIYHRFLGAVLKTVNGEPLVEKDLDFPDIDYGVRGVRFINATVESSKKGAAWENL
jgi:predicted dehydrogenase